MWPRIAQRMRIWRESRGGRTARNSAFLFANQVTERIASYGFLLYITRIFGPAVYGTYQTVATLVGMMGTLSDFGLSNLIVKDVAKDRTRASEYLATIFPLKGLLSLGAYLLLLGATRLLGYSWQVTALVGLAGLSTLWGMVLGLVGPCLVGYERVDLTSVAGGLGTLLTAVLGILALSLGLGLRGVFGGWLLVGGIQAVLLLRMARRQGMRMRPRLDVAVAADVFRRATPFGLVGVGLIHHMIAVVVLSRAVGPIAVGLYWAARRPLELLTLIPTSVAGALYPTMASYHQADSPLFQATYLNTVRLMMRIAFPVVLGCSVLGEGLVILLFGEAFRPAGNAFRVLSWALALAFVTSPADNVIFSAERVRAFLPYFWLKVVVHVSLDLLLIPRWSYMGASISTLASEVLDFVTHLYMIRHILGRVPPLWNMGRDILIPGLSMAGVMLALNGQPALLSLGAGMVVYGAALMPVWRRSRAAESNSGRQAG